MKRNLAFGLALLVVISLPACRTSTEITGSWVNPSSNKSYNKILVTALTDNVDARTTVESDLAEQLSDQGVEAVTGTEVFPPRFGKDQPEKEELLDEINKNAADAILTVNLVDEETDSRYVPGTLAYSPFPRYSYYGRFWGYYSYWQPQVFRPGYYSEDKIYYIETNLYDAATEQLIWSAQSQTYNPSGLENFSEGFAETIIQKLKQENLL